MEKYRRFADAATGINPFVAKVGIGSGAGVVAASSGIGTFQSSNIAPHFLVTGLAYLFFPIRIIVIAALALVLFILEAIGEGLRRIGLQTVVGDFTTTPLALLTARALLAVCAALSVRRRTYPLRKSPSVTIGNGAEAIDGAVLTPLAGDVVISNLVTPFDWMALQAATPLRPWLLTPTAKAMETNGVTENAWRVPSALVAFVCHHKEPRLVSFPPGPLQRWRVFLYILSTTKKEYLAEGAVGPSLVVDVSGLQATAKALGVPLVVFPEGTTSSGQTMLACGGLVMNTANNNASSSAASSFDTAAESSSSPSSAQQHRTHIISLSYESAVPAKVIESSEAAMLGTAAFFGAGSSSPLRYLFNLSRRGSGTVATSSAANAAASADALSAGVFSFLGFGSLFGYQNAVRVTFVRPSNVPIATMPMAAGLFRGTAASPLSPHSPGPSAAIAWVDEVRAKLCASVAFGNPNVLCKPVAVGIAEKRAYSEYVDAEGGASASGAGARAGSTVVPDAAPPARPGAAARRPAQKRE